MLTRLKKTYEEFPRLFWMVVGTLFIDSIGNTLLFPFFALYITKRFGVGMTEAGILLGMSSLFGLMGSIVGGAITDRFGRRRLILFGLTFSALSSLSFGLASEVTTLYFLIIIVGLLSRVAAPAYDAMLADILPEAKRQEGFGIMRIAFNYAWILGTALGGFIAARSFLALFIMDAILSIVAAAILYRFLPETKPMSHTEVSKDESFLNTVMGYQIVLRDLAFMSFLITGMIVLIVYQQQYSSLPVYLRDVHDIDSKSYGMMLSISGLEVVIFQFWISRTIRKYAPILMMMLGALFLTVGFGMMAFIGEVALFLVAVVVITVGEMIFFPTGQVLAANFAREDMRGRYMAVYGFAWAIPATIGPAAAGLILDNYNPDLLWYIGGILCAVAALGFYALHLWLGKQKRFMPAEQEGTTTT
ncbi:MAG TPA: MFS transporter [Anaerolineales bacterium]